VSHGNMFTFLMSLPTEGEVEVEVLYIIL
jgi:hypothetical protein